MSRLGFCFPFYLGLFLIQGLTIGLSARGVFAADSLCLVEATGIFAAAWIVGFLTSGAPAGVGVRETVIVVGLTPVYDEATAIGLAVVLRVISMIGDGLGFAVAMLLKRKRDHSTNHTPDVSP